jgi:hypothetical protein
LNTNAQREFLGNYFSNLPHIIDKYSFDSKTGIILNSMMISNGIINFHTLSNNLIQNLLNRLFLNRTLGKIATSPASLILTLQAITT